MNGRIWHRWSARAVAALFMTVGCLAIVAGFVDASSRQGFWLVGALNVATAIGLLLERPAWRTVAVVILSLELIGTLIFAAQLLGTHSGLIVGVPGHYVVFRNGLRALVLAGVAGVESGCLWVLMRVGESARAAHT